MKKIIFLVTIILITLVGCSDKEAIIDGPSGDTISMLSNEAMKVDVERPSFVSEPERPALVQENYALSYKY